MKFIEFMGEDDTPVLLKAASIIRIDEINSDSCIILYKVCGGSTYDIVANNSYLEIRRQLLPQPTSGLESTMTHTIDPVF